jgi:antitoxin YefM
MYIKSNMLSTTMSDFRKEMKKYLDLVTKDFETLIINRGKDKGIVVISLDEYNSFQATLHEMSSKANERWLDESIKQFEEGEFSERDLIDP